MEGFSKLLDWRIHFARPEVTAIWITSQGCAADAHSITNYVKLICFNYKGIFLTPIDFRRIIISQNVMDFMLGKITQQDLENLTVMCNTTTKTAKEYYNIRDMEPIAEQVMNRRMEANSTFMNPQLRGTINRMRERSKTVKFVLSI